MNTYSPQQLITGSSITQFRQQNVYPVKLQNHVRGGGGGGGGGKREREREREREFYTFTHFCLNFERLKWQNRSPVSNIVATISDITTEFLHSTIQMRFNPKLEASKITFPKITSIVHVKVEI